MKTSGCPLRSSVWSCEVVLAPPVDVTSPFPPPLTPVYSLRTAVGSRGEGGLCFPSTTVVINNIFPINPRRLPRENRSSYFLISFNLCPNIPLFLCSAPWPFTSSRGCGRASTTISHTHTQIPVQLLYVTHIHVFSTVRPTVTVFLGHSSSYLFLLKLWTWTPRCWKPLTVETHWGQIWPGRHFTSVRCSKSGMQTRIRSWTSFVSHKSRVTLICL